MEKKNIDPILISKLIAKALIGELSIGEEVTFEQWLSEDPKNREIFESYKNEQDLGRNLEIFGAVNMDSAWERMQGRIMGEAEAEPVKKSIFYTLFHSYKIGAAAAILLLVGWAAFLTFQPDADPGIVKDTSGIYKNDVLPGGFQAQLTTSTGKVIQLAEQEGSFSEHDGAVITIAGGWLNYEQGGGKDALQEDVYNTLFVPKGGTFKITLADGTKVWMNSESEMQFPVQFKGDVRQVKLKGEAYFEVAKNVSKPFVIDMGGSSVEVLGTEFNVNATAGDIKTTLVEGSVKLRAGNGASLVLKPGELGNIDQSGITKEKADLRKMLAWKNNEFYFKDDRLVDILNQAALWYDLEVEIDKNIENVLISGSIDKDVKLSELLSMLKYITKGTFNVDGRKLMVTQ